MIQWETAFQAEAFMAFLTVGLASGLLCDLAAPAFRSHSAAVHIAADFLLCSATAILCFFALAMTGREALRLYMALDLAMGAALYRLGVHRLFIFITNLWKKNRKSPGSGE